MANHSHIQVEEWLKQGQPLQFNSGKTQRVITTSIPAIEMNISYKNLTKAQFEALQTVYEANHANTVIVDADDIHDLRPDVMGLNASVWAFKEFKFNVVAPSLYSGTIKMVTSVFFNYTQYQDAFTQSSAYTPITSTDTGFTTVLTSAEPYQVSFEYISNSIFSNIGQSARHIKDKDGLRRKYTLSWLLQETAFLELIKFYRKKAGIMGTFGMPKEGSISLGSTAKTKAYFMMDSFKFDRRVDGMYICNADIVESLQ
jgi:hypothetical protein